MNYKFPNDGNFCWGDGDWESWQKKLDAGFEDLEDDPRADAEDDEEEVTPEEHAKTVMQLGFDPDTMIKDEVTGKWREMTEDDIYEEVEGPDPHSEDLAAKPKMRALSIRQPFAELIMRGKKVREYRTRKVNLRERVYIYACKTPGPAKAYEKARLAPEQLPHGVLIGSVEIVNCTRDHGKFKWHLSCPRRLKKFLSVNAFPQPGFFWPFGK